jgi:two-component system sensor kinase FixL
MNPDNPTNRIWQTPETFPPGEVLKELENLLRSNPDLWLKFTFDGLIVDYNHLDI